MDYYFASIENFDGKILYPRIPSSRMGCEDDNTPRICVSKSINGCLTATNGCLPVLKTFWKDNIVNIYKCNSDKVIQPSLKQVPDACFTGEEWILEPVRMELFMRVHINNCIECKINDKKIDNFLYQFEIYEED